MDSCTGRLEAELLAVTKRATTVASMLPRDVTPVNLEVLRRLKLSLVELESKAASLRYRLTLSCGTGRQQSVYRVLLTYVALPTVRMLKFGHAALMSHLSQCFAAARMYRSHQHACLACKLHRPFGIVRQAQGSIPSLPENLRPLMFSGAQGPAGGDSG